MLAYIVEDSIDVAEVERFALEGNDFEVKSFDNSRGFFYAMTEKKPDLILLDILIGNESGFDILDKIKSYAEYRYIPVILASR